jgi:hypothetical protein
MIFKSTIHELIGQIRLIAHIIYDTVAKNPLSFMLRIHPAACIMNRSKIIDRSVFCRV